MEIILNGDNDQPTTCHKCGDRTDFEELDANRQVHVCLKCSHVFILEFDEAAETVTISKQLMGHIVNAFNAIPNKYGVSGKLSSYDIASMIRKELNPKQA